MIFFPHYSTLSRPSLAPTSLSIPSLSSSLSSLPLQLRPPLPSNPYSFTLLSSLLHYSPFINCLHITSPHLTSPLFRLSFHPSPLFFLPSITPPYTSPLLSPATLPSIRLMLSSSQDAVRSNGPYVTSILILSGGQKACTETQVKTDRQIDRQIES